MKLERIRRYNQLQVNDYLVIRDTNLVRVYKVLSVSSNEVILSMFESPYDVSINIKDLVNLGTNLFKIPQGL